MEVPNIPKLHLSHLELGKICYTPFHLLNDFLSEEEFSQEIDKITGYIKEKNFFFLEEIIFSLNQISNSSNVEDFNFPIDL